MLGGPRHAARDAGSTSTIGLAIAAVVFAGAFMTAEIMVGHPTSVDGKREQFDAEAATALDVLVGTGGQAASGANWTTDPDHMTRFGLALNGSPNFLDYAKIRDLRNGTMSAASNGYPDYPEVLKALGISTGDIHIRSYPVMPNYGDPRWVKEQHGRLGYVGHYTGANAPVNVTAKSAVLEGTTMNVSVTVRNDALIPAIFTLDVSPGNVASGATLITDNKQTGLLQPGESQTVFARFAQLSSWTGPVTGFQVGVTDPFGNDAVDANGAAVGPFWISGTPSSGGSSSAYNVLVSAGEPYDAAGGSAPTFSVDSYQGDGTRPNNPSARFVLVGPDGHEWQNSTVSLSKSKATSISCSNCTTPGLYTGIVYDGSLARRNQDGLYVSASKMFTQKSTLDPLAIKEIALLSNLVSNFNPTRYDSATNPEGDVFGDDVNGASDVVGVMSRYTTIVVGSQIQQTCLTPSSVKNGLANWVQGGGNLVVLGTTTQQSQWLQPIYHAAQTTANGGISAPDATNPILVAPEHLNYQQYLDRGRAWAVDTTAPFTHVLTRGTQGTSTLDTLVIANPGAYNNGTVVLTSYMPGSLTSPQDDIEATRLLHNLLSQAYTMLFLDYGPPIPPGVSVGSDARLVAVPHPNVPGAVVEVKLVLYRFG